MNYAIFHGSRASVRAGKPLPQQERKMWKIAGLLGCVCLSTLPAKADCNPRDFLVKDIEHVIVNEKTRLAYLMTTTEEEFKRTNSRTGGYLGFGDLVKGGLDFANSQAAARRMAKTLNFEYDHNFYLNYL